MKSRVGRDGGEIATKRTKMYTHEHTFPYSAYNKRRLRAGVKTKKRIFEYAYKYQVVHEGNDVGLATAARAEGAPLK